jgi:hypothetical protein
MTQPGLEAKEQYLARQSQLKPVKDHKRTT